MATGIIATGVTIHHLKNPTAEIFFLVCSKHRKAYAGEVIWHCCLLNDFLYQTTFLINIYGSVCRFVMLSSLIGEHLCFLHCRAVNTGTYK